MSAEAIELHQPARESKDYTRLRATMALAKLGCRPQLIQKLTRAGMPTIRWMIAKVGGIEYDFGGRQPRSMISLLGAHGRQVEASLFLRSYVRFCAHHDDVTNEVHTVSFVYALNEMLSTHKDGELTPDHAHMLATLYHQGEVLLKTCDKCPTQYAATADIGTCPLCDAGAAINQNVALPTKRKPLTNSITAPKGKQSPGPGQPDIEESTKASDQLGTLQATIALVELGARAQMIQRMTSAGMPTIRGLFALLGRVEKDRGGRHPRAITTLLEYVPRHIEASKFLNIYMNVLEHYGGGRGVVHVDAFIRSMLLIKSEMHCPEFTPDLGHLVASLYHSGEVHLKKCQVCSKNYLAGHNHQVIRSHITVGDCPLCRNLATIESGRTIVKIPDVREQRRLYERFAEA